MTAPFSFKLDATDGLARAGQFTTPHGVMNTPQFMPVGTLASVKSLDPEDLQRLGATMILANAYHLRLRPGDEMIRTMGGLHRFMHWDGPMLTDSGGFQVFSLEGLRTINEQGVEFRSHLDGSLQQFTPESVMRIERNLGADVIMQFDHVVPGQTEAGLARVAMERSIRWLERCRVEFDRLLREDPDAPTPVQALFPIVQGGIHADLRRESATAIRDAADWVGLGIGGLSVGEAKPDMYAMLDVVNEALPTDRPRYLMGVGFPEDLVEGVARGVDDQAEPGVVGAADGIAAVDEAAAGAAGPEPAFEDGHGSGGHGANARRIGDDGGIGCGDTASAQAEFGAAHIGYRHIAVHAYRQKSAQVIQFLFVSLLQILGFMGSDDA